LRRGRRVCESRRSRSVETTLGAELSAITPETFAERFPQLAGSLGEQDLAALIDAFELRDADPGEALVAEGTPSSHLFLVWDGELEVTMSSARGPRGLVPVRAGSYFGEVSLLDPGPATASVVTEQGCVALQLSRARLDELSRSNPVAAAALLREVLQSLVARLRRATRTRAQLDG
jgi:CRP/FNR family transcriptional regulator, cyclic AMP receptor protein